MAPRVLHVAFECVPFSKVGGMGDVVGALPRALRETGFPVEVLTPLHRRHFRGETGKERAAFEVRIGDAAHQVRFLEAEGALLLDCPAAFDRPGIYDDPATGHAYPDNLYRSLVLQLAARHALRQGLLEADVVHCHDHHTGLLPAYMREDGGPATVLTIHNLAYQGNYPGADFWLTHLPRWHFYPDSPFEEYGTLNCLKAGVSLADRVTTVSPTYAKEIVRPEYGNGLDGVLRRRGQQLVGILNGIDETIWNPETDSLLPARYSAGDLEGKAACKRALREKCGLSPDVAGPLCGMVSRVTEQKGLDVIPPILPDLVRSGAQVVLLGSGDPAILDLYRGAAAIWPGRVAVVEGFRATLAHLVYAGSDIVMIPSRFEPCGLNQMYAMRYGAVPVATRTGGLVDTVLPFDEERPDGTGVLADSPTSESFRGAVGYAMELYERPDLFSRMRENGMRRHFSWEGPAREYARLYEEL